MKLLLPRAQASPSDFRIPNSGRPTCSCMAAVHFVKERRIFSSHPVSALQSPFSCERQSLHGPSSFRAGLAGAKSALPGGFCTYKASVCPNSSDTRRLNYTVRLTEERRKRCCEDTFYSLSRWHLFSGRYLRCSTFDTALGWTWSRCWFPSHVTFWRKQPARAYSDRFPPLGFIRTLSRMSSLFLGSFFGHHFSRFHFGFLRRLSIGAGDCGCLRAGHWLL